MRGARLWLVTGAFALPIILLVTLALSRPSPADAHPLGNFTVNRYSKLELYSDAVRIRYVLDMAEIPTYQEMGLIDTDGDGQASDDESQAYLVAKAGELQKNLHLAVNGSDTDLAILSGEISYPEGQAGLHTLRISLLLQASSSGSDVSINYRDDNYSDRIGWKEIVVQPAAGVTLSASSAGSEDISHELTSYPQDMLSSPLDVRDVSARFQPAAGALAPAVSSLSSGTQPGNAAPRAGAGFTALIAPGSLTLPLILLSLAAAFGFGAIHALEPGHGKTFVAAYFVGVRGTARQAMLLGAIVAVTHTIGVFAIGILTLFGSQFILPERLYPWLSLASAIMVLALGVRLIASRSPGLRFIPFIGRLDDRGRHSDGHDHSHRHDHSHGREREPRAPPWKGLIALGFADGLTPSPSALIVLLAAVSLHRIGIGVLLILAFSLGLAAVLTLVSLGLVYARRSIDWLGRRNLPGGSANLARLVTGIRGGALANLVPAASALVLIGVGVLLTVRALSQPGLPIF